MPQSMNTNVNSLDKLEPTATTTSYISGGPKK